MVGTDGQYIDVDVPMDIIDSKKLDRIWAKKGTIKCQVSPLSSSGRFEGIRAKGAYGNVDTIVTLTSSAPYITLQFKITKGSGTVKDMGVKQIVFYVSGNQVAEMI